MKYLKNYFVTHMHKLKGKRREIELRRVKEILSHSLHNGGDQTQRLIHAKHVFYQ
jgi:hypothetical protein